ncbi:MAG: SpoIIE family protein phosphatase [Traorella sp.]
MKTNVLQNKTTKFQYNHIVTFNLSILLSFTGNIHLLMSVFPYIFMKSSGHKLIFILPTLILYWISPFLFFEYMVYLTGYFILSYLIRRINGNLLLFQKYYIALFSASISYLKTADIVMSISLMIVQLILFKEMTQSFEWLKKESKLPLTIYVLVVMSFMLLAIQYMNPYQNLFIIIGFIFICFKTTPLISIISLLFINTIYPMMPYESFIAILLLSLLKEDTILMLLVFFSLFVTQANSLQDMMLFGLYFVFILLLSNKTTSYQANQPSVNSTYSHIHKQLANFSLIFEHLSTYYENVSKIESDFLKSMSNALHYTSKKRIHDDLSVDFIKNQVISILEGYEIGYEEVYVENNEEGFIRIICSLLNFNASEVKEVLLPLLNHLLPTPMECLSMRSSWLQLGVLNVEFVSTPPIQIDAYADSTHIGKVCGDSFSIFNHSLNVYCLISDGMGCGNEASKISKCIVALFQRMIFSNIQEIEAMNCINKLLLSDAYATCDVLIFNRFKKTVTICKSAANPTYLIRNQEIYAIWGNSLPIGIVAHIDIDSIHVQIEKDDVFIMSSDGVEMDEILVWMKESKQKNARNEVEHFMSILNRKEREDDSTILLAKVL